MLFVLLLLIGCAVQRSSADWYDHLGEDDELRKLVDEHGRTYAEKELRRMLNKWKETPINVAITGDSGTGKSSFINAIRGLTGDDEGAAGVGTTETTSEPTPYPHPKSPKVIFWDLPGVGTPAFKKENYLNAVGFSKYDFFLIFSHSRFTENDAWLAAEIIGNDKSFFFVRAKIDIDVDNEKWSHPKSFNETDMLKKVRDNCNTHLISLGIPNPQVFLISNRYPTRWDFPLLTSRIIEDLPEMKRETLIMSLQGWSKDQIHQKKTILESRIWKIAALSAIGGAVPYPGVSFFLDTSLILNEARVAYMVFGLDEESIDFIAKTLRMDRGKLNEAGLRDIFSKFCTKEGILYLVRTYSTSFVSEEVARYVPFVGSAIAGSVSYYTTSSILEDMLNIMEETAIKLHDIIIDHESRQYCTKDSCP